MTEEVKVPKEKWELQITDTLKIQQFDDKNFVILQLKEGCSPKNEGNNPILYQSGLLPNRF